MKTTGLLFTPGNYDKTERGIKTMTRRVIKPQPNSSGAILWPREMVEEPGVWLYNGQTFKCPFGTVGDQLYVKEGLERYSEQGVQYRRDKKPLALEVPLYGWQWQRDTLSPLHMPKWAARLWLELTEVRVERLDRISEADAILEGCTSDIGNTDPTAVYLSTAVCEYRHLWDYIHGPGAWDRNPWVWVLGYKKITLTGEAPRC